MKKLFCVIFGLVSVFILAQNPFTIVLDAGHGGRDPGSMLNDSNEKQIVQEVAHLIYKLNQNKDIKIILTREVDEFIELPKRVDMVNEIKPDLLISLHVNQGPTDELKGIEIYTSPASEFAEKSKYYAKQLLPYLQKDGKLGEANFLILAKTEVPALIVELGYASNIEDRKYLLSDKGKIEIAQKFLRYFETL